MFAHPPALERWAQFKDKLNPGIWKSAGKKIESRPLHQYENGDVYLGEWNSDTDEPDGYGIRVYNASGSIYQGYFDNGERHGRGIYISGKGRFSGDYFVGDFSKNDKHGFGVYHYSDGRYYKGYWVDNKPHGIGEKVTPDRSRYYGEFERGEYNGFGILRWTDGRRYEGGFKRGQRSGMAKWTTSNGKVRFERWRKDDAVDEISEQEYVKYLDANHHVQRADAKE